MPYASGATLRGRGQHHAQAILTCDKASNIVSKSIKIRLPRHSIGTEIRNCLGHKSLGGTNEVKK